MYIQVTVYKMDLKLLALLNIKGSQQQQQKEEVSLLHISIKKVGLLPNVMLLPCAGVY